MNYKFLSLFIAISIILVGFSFFIIANPTSSISSTIFSSNIFQGTQAFDLTEQINKIKVSDSIKGEEKVLFEAIENNPISTYCEFDSNGDGKYDKRLDEYFVDFQKGTWKWGVLNNGTDWGKYRCTMSSDAKLEKRGNYYYFMEGSGGYKADFSDICNAVRTNGTKLDFSLLSNEFIEVPNIIDTAQCSFNQIGNTLEFTFFSGEIIDPFFTFENLIANTVLSNVTFEPDNSTHLTVINETIVLYMPFDANLSQTTVYDYSPNDNDGTIIGDAHFVNEGIYGGAFSFDGINGNISMGDASFIDDAPNLSVSLWMQTENIDVDGMLLTKGVFSTGTPIVLWRDEVAGISSRTNTISLIIRGDSAGVRLEGATDALNDKNWHHISFTFQGGSSTGLRLYIDGVEDANSPVDVSSIPVILDNTNNLLIGSATDGVEFNGTIDEVMILDYFLNSSDILIIYQNQSSRFFQQGNQIFNDTDISADSPTLANFTLNLSENFQNSYFSISVDGEPLVNMTNGFVSDYDLTGVNDLSIANITLWFNSNSTQFYSPLNLNNITIDTWSDSVTDDEFPQFNDEDVVPSNNTAYINQAIYEFNSTLNSTNGTVIFDFSGTNFPNQQIHATNLTGNIFNASIFNLPTGNYTYNFTSWGNGTSANQNISVIKGYTVSKATPAGTITGTTPITFGTAGDFQGTETNAVDGDVTYQLFRNGTLVSNPDTTTLGQGGYNYTFNNSAGQNFTQSVVLDSKILVVSRIASEVNLTLNETEGNITIVQGTTISLNGTLITGDTPNPLILFNDNVEINNGTSPIGNLSTFSVVGEFNITVFALASQNYTLSFETYFVNVTQAPDNEFPQFTARTDNNATLVGELVRINITITSTNGTAFIEYDGTNHTIFNSTTTPTVFNFTINDTVAGVKPYYFGAFGNGTDANFNTTQTFFHSVNTTEEVFPIRTLFINWTDNEKGNISYEEICFVLNGTTPCLLKDLGGGSGTNTTNIFDQDLNTTNNVTFSGINITNASGTVGIFQNVDAKVGINTLVSDMMDILTITGDVDIIHNADHTDDHALELDVDAQGFGDVKAIFIDYVTGDIGLEENEEVIFINLDDTSAIGGHIAGFEMVTTEGASRITGLEVGIGIAPIEQLVGIFSNMTSALNGTDNVLQAFLTPGNDTTIFAKDDDTVTIGFTEKFEELEFILNQTASGAGIRPLFYHSTGIGTWVEFTPGDGTNGMRNTGVIIWDDGDIPTWETGLNSEFLIRINRTRNNLGTVPIENKVQIAVAIEFDWDKFGNLKVNNITAFNLSISERLVVDGILVNQFLYNQTIISNIFNQDLNTTNDVTFLSVITSNITSLSMLDLNTNNIANDIRLIIDGTEILRADGGDGFVHLSGNLRVEGGLIENSNSADLVLQTNFKTNQLFLDSGGFVGINTNNPQQTLNVLGSGNFTADLINKNFNLTEFLYNQTESPFFYNQTVASVGDSFWGTNAGNTYNDTANVGIGTNIPQQFLNVVGGVNITGNLNVSEALYVVGDNIGVNVSKPTVPLDVYGIIRSDGVGAGIIFNDRTTSNSWQWYGISGVANLYNGTANTISIVDSGEVGIGTISPQQEFNVIGDGNFTGALFVEADIVASGGFGAVKSFGSTLGFLHDPVSGNGLLDFDINVAGETESMTMRFFRQSTTSGVARLIFYDADGTAGTSAQIGINGVNTYFSGGSGGGLFGIGTSNPQQKLNVNGSGNFTGDLFVSEKFFVNATSVGIGTTNPNHDIDIEQGDFYWNEGGSDDFFRLDDNSNIPLFYLDAGLERIGIGTANPQQLLNILGSGNFTGNTIFQNNITLLASDGSSHNCGVSNAGVFSCD